LPNLHFEQRGRFWRNCNSCRARRCLPLLEQLPLGQQWSDGQKLPNRYQLSSLTYECKHCRALHFLEEKLVKSSIVMPEFTICCAGGKVQLPGIKTPPEMLWKLFTSLDQISVNFRKHIRAYNNALSMTLLGTKEIPYWQNESGIYSFRIKGALYYNHGPLLPSQGQSPKFAQIYIHDSMDINAQLAHRLGIYCDNTLNEDILKKLMETLSEVNWLVQTYQYAGEVLGQNQQDTVTMQLKVLDSKNRDPRIYNTPVANEVGILIIGLGEEEFDKRDIVLHARNANNNYHGLI